MPHHEREANMARSNVKKSLATQKASRMADVFMRAVLRDDRMKEARARREAEGTIIRAICKENDCRSDSDRSIRVWRREG